MAPDDKDKGGKGNKQGTAPQPRAGSGVTPTQPAVNFQFPPFSSPTGSTSSPEVKKWCIRNTTLYASSDPAVTTLSLGSVVTVKQQNVSIPADTIDPRRTWSEVVYEPFVQPVKGVERWDKVSIRGWVDDLYLDDYVQEYPPNEVSIPIATADPNDAQQYLVWGGAGQTKHNMCGELCVAYIVGKDIVSVLQKWEADDPDKASKYIGRGVDTTTEPGVLVSILRKYELYQNPNDIQDFLSDGRAFTRPALRQALQEKLQDNYLLLLVRSNVGGSGELLAIDKGIAKDQRNHWVVVNAVTHQGNCVELYNPFQNRREAYSYGFFYDACSGLKQTGFWVKRKRGLPAAARAADEDRIPHVGVEFEGAADTERARQYIRVDGGRKTELCGEFCVAYILTKSIDCALDYWNSKETITTPELMTILKAYGIADRTGFGIRTVLKRWKEAQIADYNTYLVQNKGTGVDVLKRMLKAYGYSDEDLVSFPQGLRYIKSPQDFRFDKFYVPTAGQIREKLKTHFLIAGVGIDEFGRLIRGSGGIRHWEVLEEIHPSGKHYKAYHREGDGGWVKLYNPFTNSMEEYSLMDFVHSMGGPEGSGWTGMFVDRNAKPNLVQPAGNATVSKDELSQMLQLGVDAVSAATSAAAAVTAAAGMTAATREQQLTKDLTVKISRSIGPVISRAV